MLFLVGRDRDMERLGSGIGIGYTGGWEVGRKGRKGGLGDVVDVGLWESEEYSALIES